MQKKQKRLMLMVVGAAIAAVGIGGGIFVVRGTQGVTPTVATPSVHKSSANGVAPEQLAPSTLPLPGELGLSDNLGHLPPEVLESRLAAMQRAGVRWVRKDIEWRGAERVRGTYDWSVNEETVAAISRYGMKPLLILSYAPTWAAGTTTYDCAATRCSIANSPEAIAAYGTFAGEAAKKFCKAPYNAAGFEIWNEPNLSKYWPHPDPVLYTKALIAAKKAIRATGCNATIVLGGLGDRDCEGCYPSTTFLEGVYAQGGDEHFDAVGSHPYIRDIPDAKSWRPAALYGIMAAHGDGYKQVWATEFGYSSPALTADQRSTRMRAATRVYRSYPWAGPLFWFGLENDLSGIVESPVPSPSSR